MASRWWDVAIDGDELPSRNLPANPDRPQSQMVVEMVKRSQAGVHRRRAVAGRLEMGLVVPHGEVPGMRICRRVSPVGVPAAQPLQEPRHPGRIGATGVGRQGSSLERNNIPIPGRHKRREPVSTGRSRSAPQSQKPITAPTARLDLSIRSSPTRSSSDSGSYQKQTTSACRSILRHLLTPHVRPPSRRQATRNSLSVRVAKWSEETGGSSAPRPAERARRRFSHRRTTKTRTGSVTKAISSIPLPWATTKPLTSRTGGPGPPRCTPPSHPAAGTANGPPPVR